MAHGKHTHPISVLETLKDVPNVREFIAKELQDMAAGRKEYSQMAQACAHIPPWSRHVWLAAAELLSLKEKI